MMSSRWASIAALLILLSAAAGSVVAIGWHAARIELKDGTVHEDCEMDVDDTYKTIKLECGETTKRVSFTDVVLIVDKAGNDITADIIGDYYKPADKEAPKAGEAEWESERERPAQGKPYSVIFYSRFGWGLPAGDYFKGVSSGPGAGVDMSIAIDRHYAVRLTGFYSRTGTSLEEVWGVEEITNDLSMNFTRLMIAAEYYDWPNWRAGGKTSWHMYFGLGVTTTSLSGDATVYDPLSEEYYLIAKGSSQSKFTQTTGVGLIHMLSPGIGLHGGVNWDLLYLGGDGYGNVSYASIFDLRVGMAFLIK